MQSVPRSKTLMAERIYLRSWALSVSKSARSSLLHKILIIRFLPILSEYANIRANITPVLRERGEIFISSFLKINISDSAADATYLAHFISRIWIDVLNRYFSRDICLETLFGQRSVMEFS